jgi:hypothetical protein
MSKFVLWRVLCSIKVRRHICHPLAICLDMPIMSIVAHTTHEITTCKMNADASSPLRIRSKIVADPRNGSKMCTIYPRRGKEHADIYDCGRVCRDAHNEANQNSNLTCPYERRGFGHSGDVDFVNSYCWSNFPPVSRSYHTQSYSQLCRTL